MLSFFYHGSDEPLGPPEEDTTFIALFKLRADQHAAIYALTHRKNYGFIRLAEYAFRAFERFMDEILGWLDDSRFDTARNAVRLLRLILEPVSDDDSTWVEFDGEDVPNETEWLVRSLICRTAARIWGRAQRWNTTQVASHNMDHEEQEDEEIDIDDGETGEDVVKKELTKACWKNRRFAKDFAVCMLEKGDVSIELHFGPRGGSRS